MKVTFLGATRTVTGSNFLVEGAGKKFLVDCGMYQGKATDELKNEEDFAFDVKSIDFMLLTHAHIDHSGRIPKLYNEGYRNPIYAHKATCDLCGIMLPDSGHIQEMEVEWKNRKRARKGEPELPPLYTAEDATKCLEVFVPVKYDEIIELDENIHVRYNDAGHMLGSSIIEVWIKEDEKEEKIVFSGDIGNNDIPLLSEPTMIEDADYLVMESTYGNRLHMKNESKAETFLRIVSETIEKVGYVEYILKAASLFRNPLAMISPATFGDLVNIPNGDFDVIKGEMKIKDNVVQRMMIKSSAKQLSSFIIGRYDLITNDASLRIYTKMSNKGEGFAGFLRNISLNSIANRISASGRNDSNYYAAELSQLPPINADEKDCQVFLTTVDGDVINFNFLSSLKRIK